MIKVVQFNDEKFGVQRGRFFWKRKWHLDLKNPLFWWREGDNWFEDCKGTKEEAEEASDKWKDIKVSKGIYGIFR